MPLIEALRVRLPGADTDHPARVIETHISWVMLAGGYAYKIKKAVDLGFVDFTTLALRRHYCDEELRLNRRLAPELYLDVVAIRGCGRIHSSSRQDLGSKEGPDLLPLSEPPVEYAVRMREFPQDALASHALQHGELRAHHIDALAELIADFHRHVDVAPAGSDYGTAATVETTMLQNFDVVDPVTQEDDERAAIGTLRAWTEAGGCPHAVGITVQSPASAKDRDRSQQSSPKGGPDLFLRRVAQRQEQGFVRECHGDLHLGNMVLLHDRLVVFDCIEFNARLRWIDVISEIAFVVMDLVDRGAPKFAHRFLNAYLEHSGDYAGLALLPMYRCYRAMVRAKVARLRVAQMPAGTQRDDEIAEYRDYLNLARKFTEPPRPMLLITHGLSGSGKSTVTQYVLETIGAVRLRTDVERKRMFGRDVGRKGLESRETRDLPASTTAAMRLPSSDCIDGIDGDPKAHSPAESGIYTPDATRQTYACVADLARAVLQAGFVCIVDAAFLKRWQRDQFSALAAELGVPFKIITFKAGEAVLRKRVAARASNASDVSDADVAILEHQIRTREPLDPEELAHTAVWDSDANAPDDPQALDSLVARLR